MILCLVKPVKFCNYMLMFEILPEAEYQRSKFRLLVLEI